MIIKKINNEKISNSFYFKFQTISQLLLFLQLYLLLLLLLWRLILLLLYLLIFQTILFLTKISFLCYIKNGLSILLSRI